MVKQVSGYTTEDGVFYDNEIDAKLHECRKKIERVISPSWRLDDNSKLNYVHVLAFLEKNAATVKQYTEFYLEKHGPKDSEEESDELHLPLET